MLKLFTVGSAIAGTFLFANGVPAVTDGVTFHDLSTMPFRDRGPTARWKTVVTDTGSFMTGELSPQYQQPPHHHEQEQITMGVAGSFALSIGGVPHHIEAYVMGLPPSNVAHNMTNNSGKTATILEYQPVARRDWLAQTPNPSVYGTGDPAPVAPNQQVTASLASDSDGWRVEKNGARVKSFAGKTIRVDMWDLSARSASTDVTSDQFRVQRFVYVFEGKANLTAGTTRRDIGREMCVEIAPSTEHVTLTSTDDGRTLVGVFLPLPR